jgi:hypothetical protein
MVTSEPQAKTNRGWAFQAVGSLIEYEENHMQMPGFLQGTKERVGSSPVRQSIAASGHPRRYKGTSPVIRYFLLCIGFLHLACNDFGEKLPPQPPQLSLQVLLSAPETLSVGGKPIVLATSLWLNLMPMVPPSGPPLGAIVYVQTTDSTALPNSISPDVIWIVYGQQIWASFLQETPAPGPNVIAKFAPNGPAWDGPVDVIVRIVDFRGVFHLLRAANQRIQKVY